jgi:hypothetical protein
MPYRYRDKRRIYRHFNKFIVAIALSIAWVGATGAMAGLVFYVLKLLATR